MPNVLLDEMDKYSDMWSVEAYAKESPGKNYVPLFLEMTGAKPLTEWDGTTEILDAGCGSGKGALELQARLFNVHLCDFTDVGLSPTMRENFLFTQACLWDNLSDGRFGAESPFDYVYCCDVMEHIPIAFTMLVAARLLALVRKSVFFSISLQPDMMGYWIGKPLHETVMPFVWWRDQLNTVGRVVQGRDLLNAGIFVVEPR